MSAAVCNADDEMLLQRNLAKSEFLASLNPNSVLDLRAQRLTSPQGHDGCLCGACCESQPSKIGWLLSLL